MLKNDENPSVEGNLFVGLECCMYEGSRDLEPSPRHFMTHVSNNYICRYGVCTMQTKLGELDKH